MKIRSMGHTVWHLLFEMGYRISPYSIFYTLYIYLKFNRFLTFFKVPPDSLHEPGKNPKSHMIFVINVQYDHGNVGHSLDITKILIVDCISSKKVRQTLYFRFFKTGRLGSDDVFTDQSSSLPINNVSNKIFIKMMKNDEKQ